MYYLYRFVYSSFKQNTVKEPREINILTNTVSAEFLDTQTNKTLIVAEQRMKYLATTSSSDVLLVLYWPYPNRNNSSSN